MPNKKFRVLNPRSIPSDQPILGYRDKDGAVHQWYEGEEFSPPAGFDSDGRMLADGFIEEVK